MFYPVLASNRDELMRPTNPLGYSLNVFPDETLAELWRTLREEAVAIQREMFGKENFPLELRFSAQKVQELIADPARCEHLGRFLRANRLELVTLNAFVPLTFHEPNVKEKVYLPRWDEGNARVEYTNACATVLAEVGSREVKYLSLSVPAGVLKRDTPLTQREVSAATFAVNLARCVVPLQKLKRCVIALEAEPGLTCERTEELVEFFEGALDVYGAGWLLQEGKVGTLEEGRRLLRKFVGVNFDTCHQLVEGEDLRASTEKLWQAGIAIFKVHISNCLRLLRPAKNAKKLRELRLKYARSKFLHQTTAFDGGTAFSLDLPEIFTARREEFCGAQVRDLRVHYHMPLLRGGKMPTMLAEVRDFSRWFVRQPQARGCPLIIETYTWWELLGGKGRGMASTLRRLIGEELQEVRSWA